MGKNNSFWINQSIHWLANGSVNQLFAYKIRWPSHNRRYQLDWCINSSHPSAIYMRQWIGSALVQIMVCWLFHTKPSSKQMLGQLDHEEQKSSAILIKIHFHSRKCIWKYRLRNGDHFVRGRCVKAFIISFIVLLFVTNVSHRFLDKRHIFFISLIAMR